MKWTPEREWPDSDVFIIGGGPSLRHFDWNRLIGHRTIGCNSAFIHGAKVCNVCLFSDDHWFRQYQPELELFDGIVVTQCDYIPTQLPWVRKMGRNNEGLTQDGTLFFGYGGNSGASAIHLALLLGAKRVFLLGFDGKLDPEGNSNWHNRLVENPNPAVYQKFQEAFQIISSTHARLFPGTEIHNCNFRSAIPFFPFISLTEALKS